MNDGLLLIVLEVAVAVFCGGLGGFTRQVVQRIRDKEWPSEGFSLYLEYFLGAVAGVVIWLQGGYADPRSLALYALIAGLSAVDVIENLVVEG